MRFKDRTFLNPFVSVGEASDALGSLDVQRIVLVCAKQVSPRKLSGTEPYDSF